MWILSEILWARNWTWRNQDTNIQYKLEIYTAGEMSLSILILVGKLLLLHIQDQCSMTCLDIWYLFWASVDLNALKAKGGLIIQFSISRHWQGSWLIFSIQRSSFWCTAYTKDSDVSFSSIPNCKSWNDNVGTHSRSFGTDVLCSMKVGEHLLVGIPSKPSLLSTRLVVSKLINWMLCLLSD